MYYVTSCLYVLIYLFWTFGQFYILFQGAQTFALNSMYQSLVNSRSEDVNPVRFLWHVNESSEERLCWRGWSVFRMWEKVQNFSLCIGRVRNKGAAVRKREHCVPSYTCGLRKQRGESPPVLCVVFRGRVNASSTFPLWRRPCKETTASVWARGCLARWLLSIDVCVWER